MKVISPAGSRQISITPKDGDEPVAYYVSGDALAPDVGCVAGYVQADGTLGESAVFQTPDDWGTIKVSDPGIIPESKYAVQSAVGTMDDPQLGEPVDVTTWKWGDVANNYGEPVGDGLIDVNDVLCAMEGFGAPAECAALDQQPCSQIDGSMNLDDLLVVTEAFGGTTFATTCAATYPPCAAAAPPPVGPPSLKKNPYYFTGQRLDLDLKIGFNTPTLALYHYRARAYDPIHGRFLQRDPAEFLDSSNLLEYVRSDPTRYADPNGMQHYVFMFSSARDVEAANTGFQLKQAMLRNLLQIDSTRAGRYFYSEIGLETLVGTLHSEIDARDPIYFSLFQSQSAAGQFDPQNQVFYMPPAPSITTTFHEALHYHIWLQAPSMDIRTDEGIAYGGESVLSRSWGLLMFEEELLNPADLQFQEQNLVNKWKIAWSYAGGGARTGMAHVIGAPGSIPTPGTLLINQGQLGFSVSSHDVQNLERYAGIKVSCSNLLQSTTD